jgi:hypothetical protein
MSRLPDGTELVRIGAPLRPEFAAWRYGDQFGRRRKRQMLFAGGGLGAFGAVLVGGATAGVSIAVFGGLIANGIASIVNGRPDEVVAKVKTDTAGTVSVRRRHLAITRLVRGTDAPLALDLRYKGGAVTIEGENALRVAGQLMPHVNRFGGKPQIVRSAVEALDAAGGAEGYIERLGRYAPRDTAVAEKRGKRKAEQSGWSMAYTSGLYGLTGQDRLALEMALHEEVEMRALRGELHALEQAWRDAEEIAASADGLLTPTPIRNALARLRRLVK